jgi:hypothetical protein
MSFLDGAILKAVPDQQGRICVSAPLSWGCAPASKELGRGPTGSFLINERSASFVTRDSRMSPAIYDNELCGGGGGGGAGKTVRKN